MMQEDVIEAIQHHKKPSVETEPTPNRSDSFYALMTKDVALKAFAFYDENAKKDVFHDHFTDLEKQIMEEPTLGTTPQKDIIIGKSTEQIRDYREEEAFQLRKGRMFWCCFICNFFGLTLTIYSLSLTVLFERYDPNPTAFYCSFVLYLPAVIWFAYVFLPCTKRERERRQRMRVARTVRNHYKKVRDSYFHGHDDSDEEEFKVFEKQMKKSGGRNSGSFNTNTGSSVKKSIKTSVKTSVLINNSAGGATGGGNTRVSIELPKAPARSSIKKVTGEKKASVQFKIDGTK